MKKLLLILMAAIRRTHAEDIASTLTFFVLIKTFYTFFLYFRNRC